MVTLPRFSAAELAALPDPYPTYARLRAGGALCRGGPAVWFVTRHAAVSALLRDPRLGTEMPDELRGLSFGDGATATFLSRVLGRRDPPDHTRLRKLMTHTFAPARIRSLGNRIGGMVDGLLDRAGVPGTFDATIDIAFPLPLMVICELIGIPPADNHLVRPRADLLARAFGGALTPDERSVADEAVDWMRGYINAMLRERQPSENSDVLSELLAAAGDPAGITTLDEIVDNVIFLFFAGFETTMNLISSAIAALAADPVAYARLRADRSLIPTAVDEFLRFDAPFQMALRTTREPIEVDGHRISHGRVIIMLLGSANRDGDVFADPDRLDLARSPNPHVSFGGGIHHCFGAALAKLEAQIALDRLLDRCATLELVGETSRRPVFRSYMRVPARGW